VLRPEPVFSPGDTNRVAWDRPAVPDWADLEFRVRVATDSSFLAPIDTTVWAADTARTFVGLTHGAAYWYQAQARDAHGNLGPWSAAVSSLQNALPVAFAPLEPADDANLAAGPTVFRWRAATDPDDDPLTYRLVYETPDPERVQSVVADLADTVVVVDLSVATASGVGTWHVLASDPYGGEAASTPGPWSFLVDLLGPGLLVGVLQNPVVTSHLEVYIAANEPLAAPPELKLGGVVPLPLREVETGDEPLYRAILNLDRTEEITLVASGRDVVGNARADTVAFVAWHADPEGGSRVSANSTFEVAVPAGALTEPVFFTLFDPAPDGDAGTEIRLVAAIRSGWRTGVFEVQPEGRAVPGLEIRVPYGSLGFSGDPAYLQIRRADAGTETALPTFYDADARMLVAYPERPGSFEAAVVSAPYALPLVTQVTLRPNAPNPFNPRTRIVYEIPAPGPVSLRVFDLHGRLVTTLFEGRSDRGVHEVVWEGTDASGLSVASGVYYYRLDHPEGARTRKMLLLR
jgi:hypothetical protein